ncbi:hypothetical protein [Bradyrhizobium guangdongense]|uniref:hypothetical protein n=1 Tax=Bradyrhizobium guangdongense TaxID=1325090 RepID=UPI0026876363
MLGTVGVSDFNALHSRKHDHEVQLYAFDVLAMDGDDLRPLPLHGCETLRRSHRRAQEGHRRALSDRAAEMAAGRGDNSCTPRVSTELTNSDSFAPT